MRQAQNPHNNQSPSLGSLFFSFFKLGITAFGGPAMVAYIRKMAVEEKKWLDEATFRDGVALCQTVPGATAMQTCAYVGLKVRGVTGAAACFIGFGLPAFCFMMILSALYVKTHNLPAIVSLFNGLQVVVVAIIANATLMFGRNYLKNWRSVIIFIIAAAMFGVGVSPILVIMLAAILGIALYGKQAVPQTEGDTAKTPLYVKPLIFILLAAAICLIPLFLFDRRLFNLAILMLRIDLFAFGGGFASVPLMFHEIVTVRSWMDGPTFLNGIALGQVTPGPIVITATFIGYLLHGPLGGLVGTVSVFLPSFLMIIGVTPYFDRLRASQYFDKVFGGILSSFVGLLLSVTIHFSLKIPWDTPRLILVVAAFIPLLLKIDILWVVLIGSAVSMLFL